MGLKPKKRGASVTNSQDKFKSEIREALLSEKDIPKDDLISFLIMLSISKGKQKEVISYVRENVGSLGELLSFSAQDWRNFPEQNISFFVLLQLLREIGLRFNRAALPEGDLLQEERRLLDYLITQMARETVEQFRIIFLNRKNQLICDEVQGKGTINHTPVYPREVARRCLELKASSIIMAHNHPSGQTSPSEGDVIMTQNVQAALSVLKVRIADHYIITRTAQISFRSLGLL